MLKSVLLISTYIFISLRSCDAIPTFSETEVINSPENQTDSSFSESIQWPCWRDTELPISDGEKLRELKKLKEIKKELHWLIRFTKRFIKGERLDIPLFFNLRERIEVQHMELAQMILSLKSADYDVIELFLYARDLYISLTKSLHLLEYYGKVGQESSQLIREVLRLNIILVALIDSHGAPKPKMAGYDDIVLKYRDSLKLWVEEFKQLGNVPIGTEFMFETYCVRADILLRILAQSIV